MPRENPPILWVTPVSPARSRGIDAGIQRRLVDPEQRSGEAEELRGGHPGRETWDIGQVSDLLSDGVCGLGGIVAKNLDRAGRGPSQSQDHAQRSRLACAVGAQETHDLTCGNVERGVVDGTLCLSRSSRIGLDEMLDANSGCGHL